MSTKTQLILEIIIFTVGLGFTSFKVNEEYKTKGRLSFTGALCMILLIVLQCWMSVTAIFIPAGYLHNQVLFTLGLVFILLGLIILTMALMKIGNYRKVLGIAEPKMTIKGIYQFTRNPQYLGYFFIMAGMAMAWWNHYAIVSIITSMMMIYMLSIVEEAHLNRVFGQAYAEYCYHTPRFL